LLLDAPILVAIAEHADGNLRAAALAFLDEIHSRPATEGVASVPLARFERRKHPQDVVDPASKDSYREAVLRVVVKRDDGINDGKTGAAGCADASAASGSPRAESKGDSAAAGSIRPPFLSAQQVAPGRALLYSLTE
jgi:hypothetical protein